MLPTPYPDLNEVLAELVRRMTAVLGDDLVGAYLQGSFAVGGFDEHSDVDWIVAVREPLREEQVVVLQDVHGCVYDLECPWAQHLEGSYFPLDVLRTFERRGEELWYLDHGARSLIRADHCNTAVVRHTARQHGVELAGPPPATLIDPIPVEVLRNEISATMSDWAAEIAILTNASRNRWYQGYIVLSYCRMWCDLTLGTVGSKRRGAAWAKERLDPSWADLIDRAWDTRPAPDVSSRTPADPNDFERTMSLVQLIMERAQSAR